MYPTFISLNGFMVIVNQHIYEVDGNEIHNCKVLTKRHCSMYQLQTIFKYLAHHQNSMLSIFVVNDKMIEL